MFVPRGTNKLFVPRGQTKGDRLTHSRTNEAFYIYTRISGPYGPLKILAPAKSLFTSLTRIFASLTRKFTSLTSISSSWGNYKEASGKKAKRPPANKPLAKKKPPFNKGLLSDWLRMIVWAYWNSIKDYSWYLRQRIQLFCL